MGDFKAKCCETNTNSNIVCSENRSRINFKNKNRISITKITVDGCQINDDGVKCDFLILANDVEHYVELKGQDISHALEQLQRTIELLSSDAKKAQKCSYIISTRSPLSSPELQNERLKFRRQWNSNLIVKNVNFEVDI